MDAPVPHVKDHRKYSDHLVLSEELDRTTITFRPFLRNKRMHFATMVLGFGNFGLLEFSGGLVFTFLSLLIFVAISVLWSLEHRLTLTQRVVRTETRIFHASLFAALTKRSNHPLETLDKVEAITFLGIWSRLRLVGKDGASTSLSVGNAADVTAIARWLNQNLEGLHTDDEAHVVVPEAIRRMLVSARTRSESQ